MNQKIIFLIILYSLIILIKCQENDDDDDLNDFPEEGLDDDDDDDFGGFKESLKEYLIANKLYDSNKLIKPNELKIIFFEIITEGDNDRSPPYLRNIFQQLADYFIEKYYNEKKEIRGKDIYDLININEITKKFEEFASQNNPFFDDYDEEKDDLDNIDTFGNDL